MTYLIYSNIIYHQCRIIIPMNDWKFGYFFVFFFLKNKGKKARYVSMVRVILQALLKDLFIDLEI